MVILLVYAVTLFLAVLISEFTNRSVLSTAVIFLVAGFLAGHEVLGFISPILDSRMLEWLAKVALFAVLFTDGMRIGLGDISFAWTLPGRALLFGLPLTLAGTAILAHAVAGLSWPESLLLGAILSPTDPVLASAIIGRKEIPYRLRHLLNVESGLNDGLALPLVLTLMAYVGKDELHAVTLLGELGLGIALGASLPWLAAKLEGLKSLAIAGPYEPLFAFSVGLLVFSVASLSHANLYLAGFSAGVAVATVSPRLRDEFHAFGDLLAELLKLAALLAFGALISPRFLTEISLSGYLFAALVLFTVRIAALETALFGSGLEWRERLVAGWFGPKGFASVIYGLLVLQSGIEGANIIYHLTAIVIAGSILLHSTTDVLVARRFRENIPEK